MNRRHFLLGLLGLCTIGRASARSRARGWQHAKVSGHANEGQIEQALRTNARVQAEFLARLGRTGHTIVSITGGGRSEAHVPSIFRNGEPTTPKPDLYVKLENDEVLTISVKKSLAGQVHLATVTNFIAAYEAHFEPIPAPVRRAITLFWGSADDTSRIIDQFGVCKSYENHKRRIVASTLRAYDASLHTALLNWFVRNAGKLAELCFARGGARRPQDWAQYLWYKNELGENRVDAIFKISDLCTAVSRAATRLTTFGKANGGSTIQLPFGFVQWHSPQKTFPGSLQFHHKYKNIAALLPACHGTEDAARAAREPYHASRGARL